MRNAIAAIISVLCLPRPFKKWPLETRFKYSQRLWRNLDPTVRFAIWVTVSFLVLIFLFSFAPGCAQEATCTGSKYTYFWSARPNEIGDTLAGISGSIAFFWLIVTVVLQGKQLSAQRKELVLNRIEMREQSKATQEMAESQSAQVRLLVGQQEVVDQAAVLLGVKRRLEHLNTETITYFAHPKDSPHAHIEGRIVPRGKYETELEFFLDLNECLEETIARLNEDRLDLELSIRKGFFNQKADLQEIRYYLDGLPENYDRLTLAGKMYLSDLKIYRSTALLREITTRVYEESNG
ncbi:hypothetical protein [Ruegeria sp. Ofav3-42]|uniref:hypothetical protein n=1 Tax=Ruegeria sp. Ofav3-42 TaxID=2917759 RepID=UPI001EF656EB|nr:hypothetical protein [Ruegeria sp. Ofav3-42]MCG7521687.1 hypothetical protein [Ruegeria sp. Ofav3-42]